RTNSREPSVDVLVRTDVDLKKRRGAIEARADKEVDDGELAQDVVTAFELLVQHWQEAAKPRAGVGHDAWVEAWLIEHLGLYQHFSGEPLDRCFLAGVPPAYPCIHSGLGLRGRAQ